MHQSVVQYEYSITESSIYCPLPSPLPRGARRASPRLGPTYTNNHPTARKPQKADPISIRPAPDLIDVAAAAAGVVTFDASLTANARGVVADEATTAAPTMVVGAVPPLAFGVVDAEAEAKEQT